MDVAPPAELRRAGKWSAGREPQGTRQRMPLLGEHVFTVPVRLVFDVDVDGLGYAGMILRPSGSRLIETLLLECPANYLVKRAAGPPVAPVGEQPGENVGLHQRGREVLR